MPENFFFEQREARRHTADGGGLPAGKLKFIFVMFVDTENESRFQKDAKACIYKGMQPIADHIENGFHYHHKAQRIKDLRETMHSRVAGAIMRANCNASIC
jgi:hypothetical protein